MPLYNPPGFWPVTAAMTAGNGVGLSGANTVGIYSNGGLHTAFGPSTINTGAQYTGTFAGAASNAAFQLTGAILTGGTATTNFPHLYIKPSAASAVTSWSTSGTALGFNLASGFSGNFIDAHVNGGTSVFAVSSAGAISIGNTVNSVSPTSPNRTVTMVIGGSTYYLAAKTTND